MLIYNIIDNKKNGKKLSKEEIDFAVEKFVSGEITDAQMSSLLMAIVIKGMDFDETFYLTKAMQNSGKQYSFDFDVVDKHSTGGVSDSTTLVLLPILANAGLKVAKMSGKSLGTTGGTIDKLTVFNGYDYNISEAKFKENIKKIGASIIAQSKDIAIADKKIYDLRDKTATVDSIPLIASSIMSKKLACGSKTLLLDVKFGRGALMEKRKDAIKLAKTMVKIGNMNGTKTWAVLTNMNTPLASGIGSALENYSAINAIMGEDSYLRKISVTLAILLYQMYNNCSYEKASKKILEVAGNFEDVKNKLVEIIETHGGDSSFITNQKKLLNTKNSIKVKTNESGYVASIDALELAKVVMELKDMAEESNKLFQGLLLNCKINSKIEKDEVLATVYSDYKVNNSLLEKIKNAIVISKRKVKESKLICKIIKK